MATGKNTINTFGFFNFTKRGDLVLKTQKRRFKHKNTSLTPPLFIETTVPSQESERSCICLLVASILPPSTNFVLDFGNIPTVW